MNSARLLFCPPCPPPDNHQGPNARSLFLCNMLPLKFAPFLPYQGSIFPLRLQPSSFPPTHPQDCKLCKAVSSAHHNERDQLTMGCKNSPSREPGSMGSSPWMPSKLPHHGCLRSLEQLAFHPHLFILTFSKAFSPALCQAESPSSGHFWSGLEISTPTEKIQLWTPSYRQAASIVSKSEVYGNEQIQKVSRRY